MLSDILREKTDRWIAKKRREELDKAYAEGYAEGLAEVRAEGWAEGYEEGCANMQKLWEDWNGRRLECEAQGELFDEALPFLAERAAGGGGAGV